MLTLLTLLSPAIHAQSRDLSPARDAQRVALVVGNSTYTASGAALKNPGNDARLIAATLRELGFVVLEHHDLDQSALKKAIDEFGAQLGRGAVGLFYYSGHGLQVSGRNWLVPVDASIAGEADVEYEGVDVGRVLAKMESAGSQMNIVILDACRNNPFERSWRSSGQGSGLAFINAPAGTLIAYSTSPGSVAADGTGGNSPYTSALVQQMRVSGQSIEDTFKLTRQAVLAASSNQQTPWESSSIVGSFSFSGTAQPTVTPPTPIPDSGPPAWLGGSAQAKAMWSACSADSASEQCYNAAYTLHGSAGSAEVFRQGCKSGAAWACMHEGWLKAESGDLISAAALYRTGCEGADGWSCFQLGEIYRSGALGVADLPKAAAHYKSACEARIGNGCGRLAGMYRWGAGVSQDLAIAGQYAATGCALSGPLACYEQGISHQDAGDYTRAAGQFRSSCDAGVLEACGAIGILHYYGSGVAQDLSLSAQYHQRACEGGFIRSCTNLGIVHATWGDTATAASYYHSACQSSDVLGCFNIAVLYYYGNGVAQDIYQYESLIQWVQGRCSSGDAEACQLLRTLN